MKCSKQISCPRLQGSSPQQACEMVVRESQRKAATTEKPFEMALLAIDKMVTMIFI
jgi:hypothetical protein